MLTNAQFYADSHLGRRFGISDDFSGHHSGQDVNGWARGTLIPSFVSGTVADKGSQPHNLGNWVSVRFISAGRTYYAGYCHLNTLFGTPAVGTKVAIGGVIGQLGTSGYSTGPHLHAMVTTSANTEAYQGLKDPLPYMIASRSSGGGSGSGGGSINEEDNMNAIISVTKDGKATWMRLRQGGLGIQETTNATIANRWKLDNGWPTTRKAYTGDTAKTILEGWTTTIATNEAAIARIVAAGIGSGIVLPAPTEEQLQSAVTQALAAFDFPEGPTAEEIAQEVNDEAAERLAN
jgi:hypothetical protein